MNLKFGPESSKRIYTKSEEKSTPWPAIFLLIFVGFLLAIYYSYKKIKKCKDIVVKIPVGLEDLFENPVRNIVEVNSIGDPNLEDQRNFEAVNCSEKIIIEQEREIPIFLNPEPHSSL